MIIKDNVLIKVDDERIVEIPYGVERIGEKAFFFNNNVKEIIIPTTINEFDKNSMYCCFFIKTVKYQGTIEQWKEIKFNGVFSSPLYYGMFDSPLYYKKKFEFTNWRKCLPCSNSTYYSLIPKKTDEDIIFETNDYNLFQRILLYYEDLSTKYGKEMEKLYNGKPFNPTLDENSLTQTSKYFELDKLLVSNIITYFIKSNQIHYQEVVNFRKLLIDNQDGIVNFGFLNERFNNKNTIEKSDGNITIVFIDPIDIYYKDYDSKDFNYKVIKLLDNQIKFVCEYFGITQDFNVRIENWITRPLICIRTDEEFRNRLTKHKYLIENYKTNIKI